jgi:hypothetical protein
MKTLILVIVVGFTSLVLLTSCLAVIGTALPKQTSVPTYKTYEPTSKPTERVKVKPKVKVRVKVRPEVKRTNKPESNKGKSRFCAKRWYC